MFSCFFFSFLLHCIIVRGAAETATWGSDVRWDAPGTGIVRYTLLGSGFCFLINSIKCYKYMKCCPRFSVSPGVCQVTMSSPLNGVPSASDSMKDFHTPLFDCGLYTIEAGFAFLIYSRLRSTHPIPIERFWHHGRHLIVAQPSGPRVSFRVILQKHVRASQSPRLCRFYAPMIGKTRPSVYSGLFPGQ
jgi:hypothetical protein